MAYTEFNGELDEELPGYVEFNSRLNKPKAEGGFFASAKRAAGAGIKGADQAAADLIPGVEG
ncbi:hypothetical protein C8R32_12325 [Nitrosospira sp. Nsp5]|uniref:Uncharacterized protein n=1 Tax=Nitrosospira multiformis TaxID=1231 RepID=A0ABY0TDE7_9PROT|nr:MULTISPECIES: hypothetical protein [Nitrosospira]PTR05361.1 hypothetical protein C8R32_12325 [Nitrosospira sp. Nsp5]SDQ66353.1 hypothetical protein SAMN05216402_1754 [Nitrosospira multiformis]